MQCWFMPFLFKILVRGLVIIGNHEEVSRMVEAMERFREYFRQCGGFVIIFVYLLTLR